MLIIKSSILVIDHLLARFASVRGRGTLKIDQEIHKVLFSWYIKLLLI